MSTKRYSFKITELTDSPKQGSNVQIGLIISVPYFDVSFDSNHLPTKFYYTDNIGVDWVFYVGDTCLFLPSHS